MRTRPFTITLPASKSAQAPVKQMVTMRAVPDARLLVLQKSLAVVLEEG
jgi:hypothetical protein